MGMSTSKLFLSFQKAAKVKKEKRQKREKMETIRDKDAINPAPSPRPHLETTPPQKVYKHPSNFPLFPFLPQEIRLLIWANVCSEPRNVFITVSFSSRPYSRSGDCYRYEHDYIWTSASPVPGILHTTRESRAEGLRQYKLGFGSSHDVFNSLIAYETDHGMNEILEEAGLLVASIDVLRPRIYFNPSVDRICVLALATDDYFPRIPEEGIKALLRECAGNGTRRVGLNMLKHPVIWNRSESRWERNAIGDSNLEFLGCWDELPWKGTKIEDVVYFGRREDLLEGSHEMSRGTRWCERKEQGFLFEGAGAERMDGQVEGGRDVGKIWCEVKNWMVKNDFDDRVIAYRPKKGEKVWPNVNYSLL